MRLARLLILGLLLLSIAGCGRPDSPIRVGLLVWPPYELAVLAREKGWLEEGSIRLVEYRSPADLSRAFRNDLLDAVFLTSHISLRFAATGVDHRIVYVIDFSRGGDALVARQAISGLPDLAGRRIGVEPSALGAYVFHRALDFAGLGRGDVEVVPMGVSEQVASWEEGRVDAAVVYEPVRTHLLERGGQVLFDSRRIPREIADVVMAKPPVIQKRPEDLQILLRGLSRALAYHRKHPEEARTIMARRMDLSPKAFRAALDGAHLVGPEENRDLLRGSEPGLRPALAAQARFMRESGLLEERPELTRIIDGQFVCEGCLR